MSERPQDKAGFWRSCLWGRGPSTSNRKDKLRYECSIPKIRRNRLPHLLRATSKLKNPLPTNFEDEIVVMTVVAARRDPERERTTAMRESVHGCCFRVLDDSRKKSQNYVIGGSRWTTTMNWPPENAQPKCAGNLYHWEAGKTNHLP